jgi:hypothetical protein
MITNNGLKIAVNRIAKDTPDYLPASQFKVGINQADVTVNDTDLTEPINIYNLEIICDCESTNGWELSTDANISLNSTIYRTASYALNLYKTGTTADVVTYYKDTFPNVVDLNNNLFIGFLYIKDQDTLDKLITTGCIDIEINNIKYTLTKSFDKSDLSIGWNIIKEEMTLTGNYLELLEDWKQVPNGNLPDQAIWYGAAFAQNKYLICGLEGRAMYSTDGYNWTSMPAGTSTGIKFGTSPAEDIAYNNSRWLVVGFNGKASYSDNGSDWTVLTPGTTTGIKFDTRVGYAIAYGNGRWVVVGELGKLSYSDDNCVSWNYIENAVSFTKTGIKFVIDFMGSPIPVDAYSVAYGNNRWVVVGHSGKASYSDNGLDWTELVAGAGTGIKFGDAIDGTTNAHSVAYGNGRWVVVGAEGKASYSDDNGETWTVLTPGAATGIKFGTKIAYSVKYENGYWLCLGEDNTASYSEDGITWTSITLFNSTRDIRSQAFGNNRWVVAGGDPGNYRMVAISNSFDFYEIDITINVNNTSDTIAEDDVVIDNFVVSSETGEFKDFTSGYPIVDETNFEITNECYLTVLDANGFLINGLATFNKDSPEMIQDIFKFTSFSKSTTDELIFEIKNRITRR